MLQNATLTISDISGKTVKVMEGNFGKGSHTFKVEEGDLPSNGVFFYTLKTGMGKAVKKMILLE